MSDKNNKSLIHRPGEDLTGAEKSTSPVIRRMTKDVLAEATARAISNTRYRIGEYELREPDYLQICDWAAAMDMSPEEVLCRLAKSSRPDWKDTSPIAFKVVDGAIINLAWDFDYLPIIPEKWQTGLLIREFGIKGIWPESKSLFKPVLPQLTTLSCAGYTPDSKPLKGIDLSSVPRLKQLFCRRTYVENLDLSQVSELLVLDCYANHLKELDLTPVPNLQVLNCSKNRITNLDLLPVPELTVLSCGLNSFNELELASTKKLRELDISSNPYVDKDGPLPPGWGRIYTTFRLLRAEQFREIDLSSIPKLEKLNVSLNSLTQLDLSPVPGLKELDCSSNQITQLDLSPVPGLKKLDVSFNRLTQLDLSPVPDLTELGCRYNQLSKLVLSVSKLIRLDCSNNCLTELDLTPVPRLSELECGNNSIEKLDFLMLPNLTKVCCDRLVAVLNPPTSLERIIRLERTIRTKD